MDEPVRSTTDGPYGDRDPFDWLGAVLGPRVDELRALLDELGARWRGDAVRVGEGTRHRLRDLFHELGLVTRADGEERLTAKQAEALREELDELEGPRRTEVVAAIKKAREFGDLSENFEYHAAKNEQGLLEARIRSLRGRLDHAEIVEVASGGEVGIGSVVEVEDESGEKMTVEVSAVGGAGTVSPTSPLGSALLGHKPGETVEVQAPRGAWRATIRSIT